MNITPDLKQFKRLAKKHNLIILSHKFYCDWLTPVSVYQGLRAGMPGESFLLESVEGREKICRFSFLGFEPLCVFKTKAESVYIDDVCRRMGPGTHPLEELKRLMTAFKPAPLEQLRFFGGFVGYLGYGLVRFWEPVGPRLADDIKAFDAYLILPRYLVIFDHITRQVEILLFVKTGAGGDRDALYKRQAADLEKFCRLVRTVRGLPKLGFCPAPNTFHSNFPKKDFLAAVAQAREYIKAGENIQVVVSQRFSRAFKADPFGVYRYLRLLNPSPYMFFLDFKGVQLAGSSPEMLVRCEDSELVTHPIAGTRKRGKTEAEDEALAKELLADTKERAEHLMLVDLARNDLGRVAASSSVNVPKFMAIEKFSHVMHIVSEVRARLAKGKDMFDAFVSCFPAGTLSGAPKVRAMQIINELEPAERGPYGGAVGYFSFTGDLDTCITIRTVAFKNGKAYVQAGAGIVSDSVPSREYQETLNKAQAQMLAVGYALGDKSRR